MKKLLLSAAIFASVFSSTAQLADGSIAPDFTITAYQPGLATAGMNGNGTYNLYSYLDAGYTVFLEVSATWCGPCWGYHTGGAFEAVYAEHGPIGHPGVSGTSTDDAMTMWIEGDGATADATMLDGAGATIGNWINPTGTYEIEFPMANPAAGATTTINNNYNIGFFPTIYKICPNRTITLVGQQTAAALYAGVGSCPAPASNPSDAAVLTFDSPLVICDGNYTPIVTIQNNGTTTMSNATITVMSGAATVSTGTYAGNLATYGVAQITCTPIVGYTGGTLNVIVTTTSDANAANGTISGVVSAAVQATGIQGTVHIITDQYGTETTWNIKNSAGTTIASGGPYTDLGASGTTVQPVVNASFVANECYTFNILDSYGDGIAPAYGVGSYTVRDGSNAIIATGGEFTDAESKAFKSGVSGIEELAIEGFNVYPNPASDVLNVSFEASNNDYVVSILDLQGRVIANQNHTALNGAQTIAFDVNNFAKGSYIVTISANGLSTSQNVVIK